MPKTNSNEFTGFVKASLGNIQNEISEIKSYMTQNGDRIRALEDSSNKARGFMAAIGTIAGAVGSVLTLLISKILK